MKRILLFALSFCIIVLASAGCASDTTGATGSPAAITFSFLGLPDTLTAGDIALFGVRVQDSAGTIVPQPPVTLSSSDTLVAVVDGAGRVRGVSAGTATIRASALGASGSAVLVVRGGPAVFHLRHFGGGLVPVFVETDTVRFSDGTFQVRDFYLDSGTLTLSGGPHAGYQTTLHFAEYIVSVDDAGQRHLTLDGTHDLNDQGSVSYDARGDLTLTSLLPNLTESASAETGGIELFYRFSASDTQPTEAFFARAGQ